MASSDVLHIWQRYPPLSAAWRKLSVWASSFENTSMIYKQETMLNCFGHVIACVLLFLRLPWLSQSQTFKNKEEEDGILFSLSDNAKLTMFIFTIWQHKIDHVYFPKIVHVTGWLVWEEGGAVNHDITPLFLCQRQV